MNTETLLSDLSTQFARSGKPYTGTLRPTQAVWVETFGCTLAGFMLYTHPTAKQRDGRNMLRVRLADSADPFGRYAGVVTVAWQQVRPRRMPWHTDRED